jgi:hypothetical protein
MTFLKVFKILFGLIGDSRRGVEILSRGRHNILFSFGDGKNVIAWFVTPVDLRLKF